MQGKTKILRGAALALTLCLTHFGVGAQGTFTNLHNFGPQSPDGTNPDGDHPSAGLVIAGGVAYGECGGGGLHGEGTVFRINTDGTGFTNLHQFSATTYNTTTSLNENGDGAGPSGSLQVSGTNLYGVTGNGGSNGAGV